jgi:hypothetical protein
VFLLAALLPPLARRFTGGVASEGETPRGNRQEAFVFKCRASAIDKKQRQEAPIPAQRQHARRGVSVARCEFLIMAKRN